jgi:hypothetical protein
MIGYCLAKESAPIWTLLVSNANRARSNRLIGIILPSLKSHSDKNSTVIVNIMTIRNVFIKFCCIVLKKTAILAAQI